MDEERQKDEIEALKWIYPQELTIVSDWPASGLFKISPLIEDKFPVKIFTIVDCVSQERSMIVKYLPPIELYFKCPENYPSESQPLFMVSCIWLPDSKVSQICRQLDKLWDECYNSEILFSWVSFLKEDSCSFLQVYDLTVTLDIDSLGSSSEPSPLNDTINRKNIRLTELKNKSKIDRENICSPRLTTKTKRKNHRKIRTHNQENFKYETPKDLAKKKAENVDSVPSESSKHEEVTAEVDSISKIDRVLKALPTIGCRSRIFCSEFDSRVFPYSNDMPNLLSVITVYNDQRLDIEFRSQFHICNICFESKLGAACVCVKPCRHAFCKDCINEYLTVNIKESQVQNLRCLEVDCDTLFSEIQIRQNVDDGTFQKYLKFSRKLLVQNDTNLLYCPRKFCQGIARLCSKEQDMGFCGNCNFYFCAYCYRSYHGVESCKMKSDEVMKVIREYQSATPVRKAELEKRFSKKQIMKWVEDDLSEQLIKKSSKPCPNCGALIEKNHGCNKILCFNCNVPFCWLCNTCLSHTVPYAHYQNKYSPCYEKLFPATFEEDEDDFFDFDFDDVDIDPVDIYYLDDVLDYVTDSD